MTGEQSGFASTVSSEAFSATNAACHACPSPGGEFQVHSKKLFTMASCLLAISIWACPAHVSAADAPAPAPEEQASAPAADTDRGQPATPEAKPEQAAVPAEKSDAAAPAADAQPEQAAAPAPATDKEQPAAPAAPEPKPEQAATPEAKTEQPQTAEPAAPAEKTQPAEKFEAAAPAEKPDTAASAADAQPEQPSAPAPATDKEQPAAPAAPEPKPEQAAEQGTEQATEQATTTAPPAAPAPAPAPAAATAQPAPIAPTAPQGKQSGKAVLATATADRVGASALSPDGKPDSILRVMAHNPSPVVGIRMDNIGGDMASWKTRDVKGSAKGVLGVLRDGQVLNAGDAPFALDASAPVLLDLHVQDNGAIAGGKTRLRVVFYHKDGARSYAIWDPAAPPAEATGTAQQQ